MAGHPPNVVLFTLSTCPACAELKGRISSLPAQLQGTFHMEEDSMEAMHERGIENVPAAMVADSGQVLTPEETWEHVTALEQMVQQQGMPTRTAAKQSPVQRLVTAVTSDPTTMVGLAVVGYLAYTKWKSTGGASV